MKSQQQQNKSNQFSRGKVKSHPTFSLAREAVSIEHHNREENTTTSISCQLKGTLTYGDVARFFKTSTRLIKSLNRTVEQSSGTYLIVN